MTSGRRGMFGFGPTVWQPPDQSWFVGKDINFIRAKLHVEVDLPNNAVPRINGSQVSFEHVVQEGEVVSFVMENGFFKIPPFRPSIT